MTTMHNNEGQVPFAETWTYPSDLKKELGASWYEALPTPQKYASGREKLLVRFYGPGYGQNRPIVAERDGFELVSKKSGNSYIVCRRKETPPVQILKRQTTGSPLDASMVFGEEEALPVPALARTESVAK